MKNLIELRMKNEELRMKNEEFTMRRGCQVSDFSSTDDADNTDF